MMCPFWNFSTLCLAPVIFPLSVTMHPLAPASIMFCTVLCPALRKNQPLSSELASLLAITWALVRDSSISSTSSCGFVRLKSSWRRRWSSWMTLPLLPITRPTCSAWRVTLVPSGVLLNVSPPKPALSVSLSRYSLTSCLSTLRLIIFWIVFSFMRSPQNSSSPVSSSSSPKYSRKISRLTW